MSYSCPVGDGITVADVERANADSCDAVCLYCVALGVVFCYEAR